MSTKEICNFKPLQIISLIVCFAAFSHFCWAYDGKQAPLAPAEKIKETEGVGIEENLGKNVDLNLKFTNHLGEEITLAKYFDGKTPVILSPVYFSCPGLCNFHLNGLTEALTKMPWKIGNNFKLISFSFDSSEKPDVAKEKRENYLKQYGDATVADDSWVFLTGDAENVKKITEQIGFKYKWNDNSSEWSHASAAIVLSPTGMISRYLPGIMFEPKDIKLAVTEAGEGKVGTFVDQLVLFCFQYNPHTSKYAVAAFNVVKLGGLIMVGLLLIWLTPVWFRAYRERKLGDK